MCYIWNYEYLPPFLYHPSYTPYTLEVHELRAWLLHYSAVVLNGILPEDYYQHHLLLVEGVYLLLQDVVEEKHIAHSSHLLMHYCYLSHTYMVNMQHLYVHLNDVNFTVFMLLCTGEKYVTANVHGLLHLSESVQKLGPLWAHSCFPFEAANGDLLKLFHGSQGVEKQVFLIEAYDLVRSYQCFTCP